MKTIFLILIPIAIIPVMPMLMNYSDYSKLTTPINGIPQEGGPFYC